MSLKRLSQEERATYLMGAALRKFMANPGVPLHLQESVWMTFERVVEAELTSDELDHVVTTTGFTPASWLDLHEIDEVQAMAASSFAVDELEPDIPF